MKTFQTNNRRASSSGFLLGRIVIGVVIVFVLIGGLAILDARNHIDIPFFKDKQTPPPNAGINYGPPTEQEKTETKQFKDNQASSTPSNTTTTPEGQKKAVTTVLSSWGQNSQSKAVEATGFVNIMESSGICTLTATRGSQSVSESIAATPNAQNVSCGLVTIPFSKLSPGSWSLTLSYNSATSQGTSQAQSLEVN